ncbi:Calcium-activated potassium channel subunit alpha-1, partial [Perkinsus olseni]
KEKRQQDISSKVWVLKGSVFSALDMQQRCVAHRAKAFLILPPELMEISASGAIREDTENVVRCVSVRRHAWQSHIVVMLLLSEHKELITAAVLPSERIDAVRKATGVYNDSRVECVSDMLGCSPAGHHREELPNTG